MPDAGSGKRWPTEEKGPRNKFVGQKWFLYYSLETSQVTLSRARKGLESESIELHTVVLSQGSLFGAFLHPFHATDIVEVSSSTPMPKAFHVGWTNAERPLLESAALDSMLDILIFGTQAIPLSLSPLGAI